jgi:hypothetical protein
MVDEDIGAIFAAVAQDIEPDLAALVGEATSRGRRLRARRRLAIAVTASISVVAVAVAATVGAHLAGVSVRGSAPTGPGGHRHTRVLKPKAHHVRPEVALAHGPGMTVTQMLAVLRTLLPKGNITYVAPYYMRGWLEINFDDGKGAADMIVDVSGPQTMQELKSKQGYLHERLSAAQLRQELKIADKRDELYCPNPLYKDEGKRPAGAPPISCTRSVLPNGDIVMKLVTDADAYSYYDYAVYISRPDHVTVSIDVGNGTLEGTPHYAGLGLPWVNRAVPPGSLALWERVVESPQWHL